MPARQGRATRATEHAIRTIRRAGADVRLTRHGAGISQGVAASVGLSRSTCGRIERAELPNVTVRQLARACAAVGLEFVGRP